MIFFEKHACISEKTCTFALAFQHKAKSNRDVAQLVAHYVRDVGVGRSSRLIPTKSSKVIKLCCSFRFTKGHSVLSQRPPHPDKEQQSLSLCCSFRFTKGRSVLSQMSPHPDKEQQSLSLCCSFRFTKGRSVLSQMSPHPDKEQQSLSLCCSFRFTKGRSVLSQMSSHPDKQGVKVLQFSILAPCRFKTLGDNSVC